MISHLHQWLNDLTDIMIALGVLVGAISSLVNGHKLKQHQQTSDERHEENLEKFDLILNRARQRRTGDR